MTDSEKPSASNRRSKLLLQPYLQIKLGLYSMILSFTFAVALLGVLHAQWIRFEGWLRHTQGIQYEWLAQEVSAYLIDTLVWILVVLVIFLVANTLISIILTHRLIGPTYAFRRHIQALTEGNFSIRTSLRQHDAFREVADDLNKLSAALKERFEELALTPPPEEAPPEEEAPPPEEAPPEAEAPPEDDA